MTIKIEEILKSPDMDSLLEGMILEKSKYLDFLYIKKSIFKFTVDDCSMFSEDEIECVFNYMKLEKEIQREEIALNNLCRTYNQIVLLERNNNKSISFEEKIERAKQYPIQDIISEFVEIENQKRNIKCPLHDDKSPSFKIYPNTNSYYCFGCHKGGNPIDFLMAITKMTFKEAINYISK